MMRKVKLADTIKRLRHDAAIPTMFMKTTGKKYRFDQGNWGSHAGDHKPKERNFCGTAGCLLGTIAISGMSDIKADWADSGDVDTIYVRGKAKEVPMLEINFRWGKKRHVSSDEIASKYYGITEQEAVSLFGGYAIGDNHEATAAVSAERMMALAHFYEIYGDNDAARERALNEYINAQDRFETPETVRAYT